eukprot:CAMPEP_0204585156 /NCGR_PEP_ID=MMETSP0661-20131031/46759_1 /ASSEMBLY_ACC=CAM_ASM_000606 /TAXON_ID=109239 /ORGANISM="Alexandrium margalefi, Strain AMGDE01CS-322" /LENGTH=145 /DNA_ID=CAMNT_0051594687 /DNA_START=45 /DNA_END=480 /DNA_ORIENTATION=+
MALAALAAAALCAAGAAAVGLRGGGPAEEIWSFGPRDGIICYQGPKEDVIELWERVSKKGAMRDMYDGRELWNSTCKENGYGNNMLKQTCYGNTFVNRVNILPHVFAEQKAMLDFGRKHYKQEMQEAQRYMAASDARGIARAWPG